MAPLIHARKRPFASTIASRIRSGLGKRAAGKASAKTTIVNSTSSTVVLRNKYRDVWEDARFTLRQGESVVVRWAPEKPYERLGAFVESTPTTSSKGKKLLQPTTPLLLIGQSTIASHQKIVLSSSKSGNRHVMEESRLEAFL